MYILCQIKQTSTLDEQLAAVTNLVVMSCISCAGCSDISAVGARVIKFFVVCVAVLCIAVLGALPHVH